MPSSKTRCRSTRSFLILCGQQKTSFLWLRRSCPDFLSWGSQRSPLYRYESSSSSPEVASEDAASLARGRYTSYAGRPCRFSRLRRSAPTGSCRSVAPCNRSWGSSRFRSARAGAPQSNVAVRWWCPVAHSPFPWRLTLRSFSLVTSSALCHHSRYLLAVTVGFPCLPCCVATAVLTASTRQFDLKVLFRCRVRCCIQAFPPDYGSMLPWAWSPQSCCLRTGSATSPAKGGVWA